MAENCAEQRRLSSGVNVLGGLEQRDKDRGSFVEAFFNSFLPLSLLSLSLIADTERHKNPSRGLVLFESYARRRTKDEAYYWSDRVVHVLNK